MSKSIEYSPLFAAASKSSTAALKGAETMVTHFAQLFSESVEAILETNKELTTIRSIDDAVKAHKKIATETVGATLANAKETTDKAVSVFKEVAEPFEAVFGAFGGTFPMPLKKA